MEKPGFPGTSLSYSRAPIPGAQEGAGLTGTHIPNPVCRDGLERAAGPRAPGATMGGRLLTLSPFSPAVSDRRAGKHSD